jgi:transcriptional regulator with XRE-family HTH domain
MIAAVVESSSKDALAHALRKARVIAGKSQEDAAQVLGKCRPTLSAIENGQRKVSAQELETLANFYGIAVSDLLHAKDNIVQNVAFLAMEPEQKALIQRLLEKPPRKVIVRSLLLVGVPAEDLEEVARALIHHLLDAQEAITR